jgi:hypothetical protein
MQVMGVNALDRSHPVEKYLRESVVFPLYDAGNIGMQMRKIFITEDKSIPSSRLRQALSSQFHDRNPSRPPSDARSRV